MKILTHALLLMLLLSSLACSRAAFRGHVIYEEQTAAFAPELVAKTLPINSEHYWTPDLEDIEEANQALVRQLHTLADQNPQYEYLLDHLDTYRFQYFGTSDAGYRDRLEKKLGKPFEEIDLSRLGKNVFPGTQDSENDYVEINGFCYDPFDGDAWKEKLLHLSNRGACHIMATYNRTSNKLEYFTFGARVYKELLE